MKTARTFGKWIAGTVGYVVLFGRFIAWIGEHMPLSWQDWFIISVVVASVTYSLIELVYFFYTLHRDIRSLKHAMLFTPRPDFLKGEIIPPDKLR